MPRLPIALAALLLASCASDPPVGYPLNCTPGAQLACACVGGGQGAQVCTAGGTLGACVCPDASAPTDTGNDGPALDAIAADTGPAVDVAPSTDTATADTAPDPCSVCPMPPHIVSRCARSGRCDDWDCAPGWADCDGNRGTGCETGILGSHQHCGTCNNACRSSQTCDRGECFPQ